MWTGAELFVWGGNVGDGMGGLKYPRDNGAFYNPSTDKWRSVAASPKNFSGRQNALAVWTGSEVFVFGGSNVSDTLSVGGFHSDSARFNPDAGAVYFYVKE